MSIKPGATIRSWQSTDSMMPGTPPGLRSNQICAMAPDSSRTAPSTMQSGNASRQFRSRRAGADVMETRAQRPEIRREWQGNVSRGLESYIDGGRAEPMMRRFMVRLVALLSLLFVLLASLARAAAPARMNVLLIISDDLNVFLGCYGDTLAKTPNIDRLAARGTRFDRAYCSFPHCVPSRNSFLTGLNPNSTGIMMSGALMFRQTIPSQVSLPQAFRLAGYFAARIGKMYHYNVPTSIGTAGHDDPASWELESNPAGVDRLVEEPSIHTLTPGQFAGTLSWYASPRPDDEHTDAMLAADAEWVLERRARESSRPFFLGVGFFRPHTPFVAPRKYYDLYPLDRMPVVAGVAEDQKDLPRAALGSHHTEE